MLRKAGNLARPTPDLKGTVLKYIDTTLLNPAGGTSPLPVPEMWHHLATHVPNELRSDLETLLD